MPRALTLCLAALVGLTACGRPLALASPGGPSPADASQRARDSSSTTNEASPAAAPPSADAGVADATSDLFPPAGGRVPYRAIAVATGEAHTCVILDDHNVKCWGNNEYGQLGLGDTIDRGGSPEDMGDALPLVDLGTGRTAVAITAGRYATCALLDDGSTKCWGMEGLAGQFPKGNIGDRPGEMGDSLAPLDFGGRRLVNAAINHDGACASMDDDTIWCWGFVTAPRLLSGLPVAPVKALSGTGLGVFALYEDGTVSPNLPDGSAPILTSNHKVLAIAGAYAGPTCALLDDRTLACPEGSEAGQIDLNGTATALGVEAFAETICALFADGSVRCPPNADVETCSGSYSCDVSGTIPLGQPATAITDDGDGFMCALLADGSVKCWSGDLTRAPSTMPWLGAGISLLSTTNGIPSFGPWRSVDLGTRP